MLYLVLILVLVALGLLVTALITANSLWAWFSIGLSLVAAMALFLDWLRRRKSETAEATEPAETEAESEEAGTPEGEAVTADATGGEAGEPGAEDPEATAADAKAAETGAALAAMVAREGTPESTAEEDEGTEGPEAAQRPEEAPAERTVAADAVSADTTDTADAADTDGRDDLAGVPAEEGTDAADLLIVCELEDQVIVVDEHPRYHLAECRWLADHDTIPIAVSEARELGFTPCARCGPDAKLAERVRKKKRKVGGLSKE